MREDFNKPNNFPFNAITFRKHKDCKHNYASFNILISDSQALINKGGSQASRKAIIALNESKIRRLRTRGRCGSTYTLKHINFQRHNVANEATINTYQTSIQHKQQNSGSQASRKAIIALNKSKIRRLRTRGRCDSTYTIKHLKFQQHNVATQATLKYTPTQIQHNHNNIMCNAINVLNN